MAVIGKATVFLTFSSSQITAESILPRGAVRELTTLSPALSLFWPFIPFLQRGTWLAREIQISLPSPLLFPGSLIQLRYSTEHQWKCSAVLLIIFCLYSSLGVFSEPGLERAERGLAFSCCLCGARAVCCRHRDVTLGSLRGRWGRGVFPVPVPTQLVVTWGPR